LSINKTGNNSPLWKNNKKEFVCKTCGKIFLDNESTNRSYCSVPCYTPDMINRIKSSSRNTKHGMARTKVYKRWAGMIDRCNNPNSPGYHNYGGRGIKVCERWHDFRNFYEDMGDCSNTLSLDRIDNDGDYCPENCRWTTQTEQCNNTRRNKHISYEGVSKTLAEWADKLNIKYPTMLNRYNRDWTTERMLITPKREYREISL